MKLRKKHRFIVVVLVMIVFIVSLITVRVFRKTQLNVPQPQKNMTPINFKNKPVLNQQHVANQISLEKFVNKKMVTQQGIYTAYDAKVMPDRQPLKRRALLSESSGLWLQYLIGQGKKKQFTAFYQATKQNFYQKNKGQFAYRYDPKTKKQATVNAGLDDLRIIRALLSYDSKYQSTKYQKDINEIYTGYRRHLVEENGQIASFYDVKSKKTASDSPLAYYDLKTLRFLEGQSKKDRRVYHQQLKLVKKGYLGDAFPLYASTYDGNQGQYLTNNLNTSESLEILLHLAEINELKSASLEWLKEQVNQQSLKNSYTINGRGVDQGSSAGNYALAALIFAAHNEDTYYERAMNIVWQQQITRKNAIFFGALSQEPYQVTYSYNNLMALLAAQFGSR